MGGDGDYGGSCVGGCRVSSSKMLLLAVPSPLVWSIAGVLCLAGLTVWSDGGGAGSGGGGDIITSVVALLFGSPGV